MGGRIKQKHIESFLQDIEGFDYGEKDRWELEQHMTEPDIAATSIFHIYQREKNLEEKIVGDLGSGTGMLMAGMIYIECKKVIGLEFDKKYMERARDQLLEKFEDESLFELHNVNIREFQGPKKKPFDMVVMNPPFGTKDEGIDLVFLEKARDNCRGNIYSMHKSSTRNFLQKTTEGWGYNFEVLEKFKFPLPKRFSKYHKKDMAFAEVDFICLTPSEKIGQESEGEEEDRMIVSQKKPKKLKKGKIYKAGKNKKKQGKKNANNKAKQGDKKKKHSEDEEEEEEEEEVKEQEDRSQSDDENNSDEDDSDSENENDSSEHDSSNSDDDDEDEEEDSSQNEDEEDEDSDEEEEEEDEEQENSNSDDEEEQEQHSSSNDEEDGEQQQNNPEEEEGQKQKQ